MGWVPNLQESVVVTVHVEGENAFVDDYPWDAPWVDRVFHEDAVWQFADRITKALFEVEGVTGVSVSWDSRTSEGGTSGFSAGLEPDE